MGDQHVLAVAGKAHQIGFPMAGGAPAIGLGRPQADGLARLDQAAAALAQAAAPALSPGQQPMPVILERRAVIDEAVDGLVADHRLTVRERQPAGDLLG